MRMYIDKPTNGAFLLAWRVDLVRTIPYIHGKCTGNFWTAGVLWCTSNEKILHMDSQAERYRPSRLPTPIEDVTSFVELSVWNKSAWKLLATHTILHTRRIWPVSPAWTMHHVLLN